MRPGSAHRSVSKNETPLSGRSACRYFLAWVLKAGMSSSHLAMKFLTHVSLRLGKGAMGGEGASAACAFRRGKVPQKRASAQRTR